MRNCSGWAADDSLCRDEVLVPQVRRMLPDRAGRGAGRQLRGAVAEPAQPGTGGPGSPAVRVVQRRSAAGHAARDGTVLRRRAAGGPEPPGLPGRRLHVREPGPGRALRDRRRAGRRIPAGQPERWPPAGYLNPRQHPDADLEPHAHLAGETRQVDHGEHPGHAAAAAAGQRAAAGGDAEGVAAGQRARTD